MPILFSTGARLWHGEDGRDQPRGPTAVVNRGGRGRSDSSSSLPGLTRQSWAHRDEMPGSKPGHDVIYLAVPKALDVNRAERVEAVEIDRGIRGRIGAGRVQPEPVAAF